jgi:hypothetical protein
VVDLARTTDAGVQCLLGPAVALQGVRVEQIASLLCERQAAFVPAKIHRLDETFVAEVAKRIVARLELLVAACLTLRECLPTVTFEIAFRRARLSVPRCLGE